MPRKKQPKYGDMSKMLEELQEKMAGERARMAGVMCEGLLTGEAAAKLGDYSDADLRRIMGYVAKDIGKYVERLEAEKAARKKSREESRNQVVPEAVREPVTEAGSGYGDGADTGGV